MISAGLTFLRSIEWSCGVHVVVLNVFVTEFSIRYYCPVNHKRLRTECLSYELENDSGDLLAPSRRMRGARETQVFACSLIIVR